MKSNIIGASATLLHVPLRLAFALALEVGLPIAFSEGKGHFQCHRAGRVRTSRLHQAPSKV